MRKLNPTRKLPGYKAPAINKAFHLLRKVAESHQRMNLTDLASELGYSKSTTHGLVHALIREGALVQGPDGHALFVGPTIVDLSVASWNYIKIVKMVQPTIEALRDRIKETMVMGALIRKRILIMTAAEAADPLKISVTPGTALPPFAGAAGKVLHASTPREQMKRIIQETGLPRYTPRSIVDAQAYLDELEQVRLKKYSVDHEEFIAGVSAVAMALNNPVGPPMAIWAVGLSSSLVADKQDNAVRTLLSVSEKLCDTVKQASGY